MLYFLGKKMHLRIYTVNQKYVKNKDDEIGIYKKKIKKWIKSNKPFKPQKRGLEKQPIHSKRFGFLDLYNRKEQQSYLSFWLQYKSVFQCFAQNVVWVSQSKA